MTVRPRPPIASRKLRAAAPNETDVEPALAAKPRRPTPSPTLASIVQQQIASDISHGRLLPGTKLEEEELARRYDVSRTPVREALRQLSVLGIVDTRQRQGVVVAEKSIEHYNNLLEVVADMEASAARYAALRMTDAERQKLLDLHQQMAKIDSPSAAVQFDKANSMLHQMIHEGAHNDILANSIAQMRMRTLPYTRMEFIREHRRMEKSHMEHDAFVHAILRREPEAAYHTMRIHVIGAAQVAEDHSTRAEF
nr:GntR family transcriptional regulator [uncultured Lichenicoccus sp.]